MSRSFWDDSQVVDEFGRCYFLYGAERRLCREYFPKDGLILDLGCGAGRTTLLLHEAGLRVIGADLSQPMVMHMKCRFPYLQAVASDAAKLPFPSAAFDGVMFSYNGLSLLYPEESRCSAIAEIARVLKPGGHFILSAHNKTGIILNLRDRSLRTIPERLFAMRSVWRSGYVFEAKLRSWVYYSTVRELISVVEAQGFQWQETCDRHGRFGSGFSRWFDPWPYHCFRKGAS